MRDQIQHAGPDASSVYAADKVAKVRKLGARLTTDRDLVQAHPRERARLDHYRHSLEMLE